MSNRVPLQRITRSDTPIPSQLNSNSTYNSNSDCPLPDYPFVNKAGLQSFLNEQLLTDELDELAPWLWLVATPNFAHIQPLHDQRLCGRNVVITEQARLHLLWDRDKLFIKPLPAYIFDEDFMKTHVYTNESLHRSLKGFLRSWTFLLQSPADLEIAIETRLLPGTLNPKDSSTRNLTHKPDRIFSLLRPYRDVLNSEVPRRYHWGQLRLGRLNFYNRLVRRQFMYHDTHRHYGTYFQQFVGPFLFVFGTVSVVLSAFQVALQVTMEGDANGDVSEDHRMPNPIWVHFARLAKWFALLAIILTAALILGLVLLFLYMVGSEVVYATAKKMEKAKDKAKAKARRKLGGA